MSKIEVNPFCQQIENHKLMEEFAKITGKTDSV